MINTSNNFKQWERKHPRYDLSGQLQVWKLPFPCLKETKKLHPFIRIHIHIHPSKFISTHLSELWPAHAFILQLPSPEVQQLAKAMVVSRWNFLLGYLGLFSGASCSNSGGVWDLYNPKKTMNYEPRSFTAWWLGSLDGAVKLQDELVCFSPLINETY